jgi:uncharacterized protein (TIGR02145 family)
MVFGELDITITNQVVNAGLKNIAPVGWHVSASTEWSDLFTAIDGAGLNGFNKLCESPFFTREGILDVYPSAAEPQIASILAYNAGITNELGFNIKSAGGRITITGSNFHNRGFAAFYLTTDLSNPSLEHTVMFCAESTGVLTISGTVGIHGMNIRCVKDFTTLSIGQTSTVTGISGKVYGTKCMPDGKEWMTENLAEILFNDGTLIPYVEDIAEWILLTAAAYCWYNNTPE